MPPKKKGGGGGKGGKKKSEGYVIDGVSTTEMTREQLEAFAHRLQEEMEREREERNFFQLERDKLRTFWEITKQQLEESRAELRNKDREIEEAEERHQVEIKVYRQKVKHLQYEHQNNLSELKAESMVSLKMAQDDYNEQETELLRDKRKLKSQQKEQELSHQDEIRTIFMNHSEELGKIRGTFEVEAREIEAKYEKRLTTQRNELNLRHRMELTEVEERKNKQIAELMMNHEKAFSDIKNYYNDITFNNLSLINSLKEQMEGIKKREERMEKQLRDVTVENHKLVEPLQQAQAEVNELSRQMKNYEKDKISLANTKTRLGLCQKDFEELKWENEVLELRFEKLQQERDDLHNRFVTAILELQQKTGLKNVLLEKKLAALNDLLLQKQGQINEVLAAANLDPTAMATVNKKLEELLSRKNAALQDLQYELARVCKVHDDLLQTYEGKLKQYGIPKEELGFIPLQATMRGTRIRRGPAGFVTTNQ
ncbi:growth arrest-specific protein 8 [Zootermopsis nevadensis]|uniref:Dynein regulatory complex subunit 4 n=1 Tax=Zootermopsis nevadensis TaxID=136037 RepID=A0A067R5Y3_ZOONE|nr:growth arrest-specific protein 8 [Zootermopsis nevadensis]KDR18764.1 Growth arrest-specific protein 8 [Zootermopsis nevadensis]